MTFFTFGVDETNLCMCVLVRGIGTSLATAMNWSGNLIIGATYLSLIHKITAAGMPHYIVSLATP